MKENINNADKRNEILNKCFDCLVENGLEKTTTRIISKFVGLTSSSLYYWFTDKDNIVIEATCFGLNQIIEDMFAVFYTYVDDLDSILEKIVDCARNYRKELRFIYQVVTSPQYGSELRNLTMTVPEAIDSFSKVLAERLDCNQEKLRRVVHLAVSVILNDIVWEKSCNAEIQYKILYQLLMDLQR